MAKQDPNKSRRRSDYFQASDASQTTDMPDESRDADDAAVTTSITTDAKLPERHWDPVVEYATALALAHQWSRELLQDAPHGDHGEERQLAGVVAARTSSALTDAQDAADDQPRLYALRSGLHDLYRHVAGTPARLQTQLGADVAYLCAEALGRTCQGHPSLADTYHAWLRSTAQLYAAGTAETDTGQRICRCCGDELWRSRMREVEPAEAIADAIERLAGALEESSAIVHVIVDAGSRDLLGRLGERLGAAEHSPQSKSSLWIESSASLGNLGVRLYAYAGKGSDNDRN